MYIFLKYLSFLYLKNNLSVDNECKCQMLSLCSIAGLLEIYTPCSIAGNVDLSLLSLKDIILHLRLICGDLLYHVRKLVYLKVYKGHKKFTEMLCNVNQNSSPVDLHGKDSIKKALTCKSNIHEMLIQKLAMHCLGNCFDKCRCYDLVSLSIVLECHKNCMPAVTAIVFPVYLYIRGECFSIECTAWMIGNRSGQILFNIAICCFIN